MANHRPLTSIISPMYLKRELDKYIAGQEEAKQVLSILGYNHHLRFYNHMLTTNGYDYCASSPPRLNGLITGPTGTGKTFLIETMANILNFPYLKLDATQISRSGFVGDSFVDHIKALEDKYMHTPMYDYLDRAIIFIDEIDKLGGKSTTTNSDDHNREVQYSLLSFVDGMEVNSKATRSNFDTNKMLFLFGGAFENVYRSRLDKKQEIGFHGTSKDEKVIFDVDLDREELEDAGLVRELLGRIHVITHTSKLTREQIKHVLTGVEDNLWNQFQSIFNLSDVHIPELSDDELSGILDKLELKNNYGMRFVKSVLFKHFQERLFHLDCDMKRRITSVR